MNFHGCEESISFVEDHAIMTAAGKIGELAEWLKAAVC